MKKLLNISYYQLLLILSLLDIVIFVNFNDAMNKQEFKLVFYVHIFLIMIAFIKSGWHRHNEVLTRSLLLALGFYWFFEIIAQTIAVIDLELKQQIYKGKTINYILALSCGCSLLILPLINNFKQWRKKRRSRKNFLKN
jgi:hypothetical protein